MEENKYTPEDGTELADGMIEDVAGGAATYTITEADGLWKVTEETDDGQKVSLTFPTEKIAKEFVSARSAPPMTPKQIKAISEEILHKFLSK